MKAISKVAVSAEVRLFELNRLLDSEWTRNYPGASWLPILKSNLEPEFEVVTADVALSHVEQGYWSAKDILVIQHVHDHVATKLVKLGGVPLIITCFESPLYVGEFYDNAANISSSFRFRILFSGLHKLNQSVDGVNLQVTFPSYFNDDLSQHTSPWRQREFMVAVIGNKYVLPNFSWSLILHRNLFWWLRKRIAKFIYGSFHSRTLSLNDIQLQDFRLQVIEFFIKENVLDLYGKGWDDLRNLPPNWQKRLTPIFTHNHPQPCENKLDKIRNYRFGVCIENAKFPGYVTEKIFDCFVAGVVPIYMGAPDAEQYIPQDCFIDMRNFNNLSELYVYLQNMSESDAIEMIEKGRVFLRSDLGQRHSYEGFAKFVENIIRSSELST